jgi:isopenicillin-N epimerase
MIDWAKFRERVLLDQTVINLNCGSFGPTWRSAFQKAAELRLQLASGPMDFYLRKAPALLAKARDELASWFNHPVTRLFFTSNVSVAINQVAQSLVSPDFRGAVLLTDLEYGCMRWCWESLCNRHGAELRLVQLPSAPKSKQEILDAFEKEMRGSVRILFFSHIISSTGLVLPAREICELARQRGIVTVVDGAHGPGQLPLDLRQIGAHAYCANLHKWLSAPTGGGFVAFDEDLENRLGPLVVSWGYRGYCSQTADWTAAPWDEPDEWGATPRLRKLEFQGTQDICPWLAIPAVLDEWRSIKPEIIYDRQRCLSGHTRGKLCGQPWKCWTPESPELHAAMTAWELPAVWRLEVVRKWLRVQHGVEVGLNRLPTGELLLRISNHFFTQESEIDVLAGVLSSPVGELEAEMEPFA